VSDEVRLLVIGTRHPYDGTDGLWHALRIVTFAYDAGMEVKLFLISDGVYLAHESVEDTSGEFKLVELLAKAVEQGSDVAACGTCSGMRGLGEDDLRPGVAEGTMGILMDWTVWADKIITY
jgi:sulfur relay (sulfurtransferase) complex TusBCD TusD component (DsrE family)